MDVKKAREILGKKYAIRTDEEITDIINRLAVVADIAISTALEMTSRQLVEASKKKGYNHLMNDDILSKANTALVAIQYAETHKENQQNASSLEKAKELVEKIIAGNLDAKHDLKGLFISKAEASGPDTDISLMDVVAQDQTKPLQAFRRFSFRS